jgi:hypothetical protein
MASLESNTSTFSPTSSTSTTQVIHISIPISTKLDRTNFLTWRSQIEPIVDGYALTRDLEASPAIPSRQIDIGDQPIPNPEFTLWHMQDRLLLGWLRSTISAAILAQHVQCQTAISLWQALHPSSACACILRYLPPSHGAVSASADHCQRWSELQRLL